MDSNSETATSHSTVPKKSPFDELSREELIIKCKGLLVIAQKAKQAKSDILLEYKTCEDKLQNLVKEYALSQENCKTLQELVDSLTEQKLNYITEIDLAQNKVRNLTEKCDNHAGEIDKFKADLKVKENNCIELMQKLSYIDTEVLTLKGQNERLQAENYKLLSQLADLESQTVAFNEIGLQQREQLKSVEKQVSKDNEQYKLTIDELKTTIKELEEKLQLYENNNDFDTLQNKFKEMSELYETEKIQREKVTVKLKSYKDKILKCATCINQLKNSRYILFKTVKEYSENIPKWQNNIIKASKMLEQKICELNSENTVLKEKIVELNSNLTEALKQQQCTEVSNYTLEINRLNSEIDNSKLKISEYCQQLNKLETCNNTLQNKLEHVNTQLEEINSTVIPEQLKEIDSLKKQLNESNQNFNELSNQYNEIKYTVECLKCENIKLQESVKTHNGDEVKQLNLQLKAVESEKAILVKEKLNARDMILTLENQNRDMSDQVATFRLKIDNMQREIDDLKHQNSSNIEKVQKEKADEINSLQCDIKLNQEQYQLLKKEYDNIADLNGLLKEEVETLKLSLEQPKDDTENLSDVNASLQADLIKLETKLSAYKQENSNVLIELKDLRAKVKEFDSLNSEYEDAKSKLASYKTENAELLNEMKEINQVLKERGESISKLQKAIDESELLIEKLEKDRDGSHVGKNELLNKVEALERELKLEQQKYTENQDVTAKAINERDKIVKEVAEKDSIIAILKDEIERFKINQSTSELPNEDMSTSTISKAEEQARMKDLDETFEEKYTKLRIFALKLKKKLNETVSQLHNAEQDKTKLEKLINEHEDSVGKQSQTVSTDEIDSGNVKVHEAKILDLEATVKTLTANVETTEKLQTDIEQLNAELAKIKQLLSAEIDAHKATKDNLEKARRDVKKKSVLSLEMEDYERSMKDLTTKMEDSKKKIIQMESTIDTQEGTITAMKTQIKLLEEQIKAEETQSRLLKEELQHSIDEVKEKENFISAKHNIITKLERDLEDEKRKGEEASLEMTSLMSEKEKVIINLSEERLELNNKVKRLEFKCAELNEKLKIVNIELEDLKTEHTSYKVRAQAVLRQNQTVDHSQEEQLKEEAAALKAQVEMLTTKLNSVQEQCAEQKAEVEASRRRVAESASEAARAQQRTARLHADVARLTHQLDSERTQHKLQTATLTQCYKTQISELESQLQKEKEELRKKSVIHHERISSQTSSSSFDDPNLNTQYLLPVLQKDESDGEMDINVSMIPREEGEGSEAAPSPPPLKSFLAGNSGRRSPVPLDRLLEEGVPEDEAVDAASLSLTPEQEIVELKRKLQAQQQRVKHVTVLLAESERESARAAQLSELLKAELRRVRGAANHAHNTQYMKNVTLKFLTLPPGDERGRLVPVLQKLLTLSNEETQKIHAVAKGLDPNPSKGWGSYLPWPAGNK